MAKSKAVATVEETKAVVAVSGYADDAGAGFEGISADEMVIPRVSILQKGSPQVDEENGAYIDGAKPGKLINSVTGQLYDGKAGILFIPVHRVHEFLEFTPRTQGGGFHGGHAPDSAVVAEARARASGNWAKLTTPEGNDLIETFQLYGLMLDEYGDYETVNLPFTGSNISTFKRFMTMARAIQLRAEDGHRFTPPLYAHQYLLRTQYRENSKGTWFAYTVGFAEGSAEKARLAPDSELYLAAKAFHDIVVAGGARSSFNDDQDRKKAESEVDDAF